ncbi:MAG TPA: hypothetical protein VKU94_00935 [Geobacterales bacterium]|nr:hypothetical protein [Geobacterales bacterium]
MASHRAISRVIEALLACLLLTMTMFFINPYLASNAMIRSKTEKKDLAEKTLAYLLYTGILREVFKGNYFLIVNATEAIIPVEYGFRISLYNSSWYLMWSYQRSYFDDADSESSYIAVNGNSPSNILIIVLAIS